MYTTVFVLALLSSGALLGWLWLLLGRGMFWRTDQRLKISPTKRGSRNWPSVSVVIPARNEAEILPTTLPTLLKQDYPGEFHIYLVDDDSSDGTSEAALRAARQCAAMDRLTLCQGRPLPPGWKGKVWAMWQGVKRSEERAYEYVLLTDADVTHAPGVLAALVDKSLSERLDLVSLMAKLRVKGAWDRLLIPAFVYFFSKLYPFRWVNDPHRRTAGAAGGCILVRREALAYAGGLSQVANEIIDDCALGKLIQGSGGGIWMGMTHTVNSTRSYGDLSKIWNMVARSAFDQLGYSPWALIGTVMGMLLVYLIPPLGTVAGVVAVSSGGSAGVSLWLASASLFSWALMSGSYLPMLHWYEISPLMAPLLPFSAMLYTLMTVSSALYTWRGRGGTWKGRTYEAASQKQTGSE